MKALLAAPLLAAGLFVAPAAHADTICQTYPFKVVALTEATSCPFAIAMAQHGAGYVYSSVTHDTYLVHCAIESHGSTTCRTDTGAAEQSF